MFCKLFVELCIGDWIVLVVWEVILDDIEIFVYFIGDIFYVYMD